MIKERLENNENIKMEIWKTSYRNNGMTRGFRNNME